MSIRELIVLHHFIEGTWHPWILVSKDGVVQVLELIPCNTQGQVYLQSARSYRKCFPSTIHSSLWKLVFLLSRFTDEDAETEQGQISYPRSHESEVAGEEFNFRSSDSRVHIFTQCNFLSFLNSRNNWGDLKNIQYTRWQISEVKR